MSIFIQISLHTNFFLLHRILEPVKEKRISFDDSSMHKHLNGEKTNPNDSIPSFATLPRKKKLGSGTTSNAAPSPPAAQVTWMKEVAQKGSLLVSHIELALRTHRPQIVLVISVMIMQAYHSFYCLYNLLFIAFIV